VRSAQQANGSMLLVSDLTRLYTQHYSSLRARAYRYLQNDGQAEEIVQEAFLKLMLAAPDLESEDHLLAYLRTSITNLCTDVRRAQGRGPLLVAVDDQTSQDVINELSAAAHIEMSDAVVRAEDSAIVREAISRLTPAERAILLAWDVEGLSTEEIAAKFALKPASIKRMVYNARASLRRVLEEWVVDERNGTTAAQMLSSSYKVISENSKKIGGAVLSLVLLVGAFFGFWNNPSAPIQVATPQITTEPSTPATPSAEPFVERSTPVASVTTRTRVTAASEPDTDETFAAAQQAAVEVLATMGPLGWPGFDASGRPVGFTVNNGGSAAGEGVLINQSLRFNTAGAIIWKSDFMTLKDGINVLLSQNTNVLAGKMTYTASPMVRVNGEWVELVLTSRSVKVAEQSDGNFMITAYFLVDTAASDQTIKASAPGLGTDAASIPGVVATRLLVTPTGLPVIGQAVQVLAPLAGQT
jgi:RNA polymerase sigma factor (sigma-70 family)